MTTNPQVLPLRKREEVIRRTLRQRLDNILPLAMRESAVDMWLIVCQEDDYDPIFRSMIPFNTWAPILQMLIFYDPGANEAVERINLSMMDLGDLYSKPWNGRHHDEQWLRLAEIVQERDPQTIAINIADTQWAVGGLTHNLYRQLAKALPAKFVDRFVSAERVGTRWLATLTDQEIVLFEHAVAISREIIAECYSRELITPGVTTTEDLEWHYRQRCAFQGMDISFRPFFNLVRREGMKEKHGASDGIIRPGDLIHCDVGLRYLRLNTDHQQWAYILRAGETEAPQGVRRLLSEVHRLQAIFMDEFVEDRSGNELLKHILHRARKEGIPNPKVYSHSLGLLLHEPGPLIGLPWEQQACPGRGDVRLKPNYAFTMELSIRDELPEWDGEELTLAVEEDVVYTKGKCRPIGGRQKVFYPV